MSSGGSELLSNSSVESTISQMPGSAQTLDPSVESTILQMPGSTQTSDPRYFPNIYEIISIGAGGAALIVTIMIFCMLVLLACLVLHVRYIIKKKQVYRIGKEENTELVQLTHSNDQEEFVNPVLGEEEEEEEERTIKTTDKNKKHLLPSEPSSCNKSQTVQTQAITEVRIYTDPFLNDSQTAMSKTPAPYIKPVKIVKRTGSAVGTELPKSPPRIKGKDITQSHLPVVPKPIPQPPKIPPPATPSVLPPPKVSKIKFPPPPPTSAPPPTLAPPPPPPVSSPQEKNIIDDVYDSNSLDEEQGIYDDVTTTIIDDDLSQENYEEVDSKVNIGMRTFASKKSDKQIAEEYEPLEFSHAPASLKSEDMYF